MAKRSEPVYFPSVNSGVDRLTSVFIQGETLASMYLASYLEYPVIKQALKIVEIHAWEIEVTSSSTGDARFEFASVELIVD